MIRQTFIETVGHYSNDEELINTHWREIEKAYSSRSRYYHNLNHLDFLLNELVEVRIHFSDWDTVIFSIVYHDVIYNALKKGINFFTDADLAILGAGEGTYQEYVRNVRKEYSIFPDMIYNPGRKKVLNYFLDMEKIFKTQPFFLKYEKQARTNLKAELLQLK